MLNSIENESNTQSKNDIIADLTGSTLSTSVMDTAVNRRSGLPVEEVGTYLDQLEGLGCITTGIMHVRDCIQGGALLAGAALLQGMPPTTIISVLPTAAQLGGCGDEHWPITRVRFSIPLTVNSVRND